MMLRRLFDRQRTAVAVALCLGLGGFLSSTQASFTTVNPAKAPELSVSQILNHIYGGHFTAIGVNYSNPQGMLATRIDDLRDPNRGSSGGSPLSLVYDWRSDDSNTTNVIGGGGFTTDQLWTAPSVVATARARYASFSQEFGWVEGTSGGVYQSLFTVHGSGFDVQGTQGLDNMSNRIWRWARTGQNGLFTSQNVDNPGSIDHMVTYRISSNSAGGTGDGLTHYLLFFEDLRPDQHPDYDYNDLVVEIVTAPGAPLPEPTSVALISLMGFAGTRMAGRRRGN